MSSCLLRNMIFDEPGLVENPYPHYKRWREDRPIWWAEDIKAWVLTRHEDVRYVLKNAGLFSSNSMGEMDHQPFALPLLTDDPPRHTQLRGLVNKAFTSRTLKKMEAEIQVLVEQLLDDIEGQATIDITANFTIRLPVALIARLMGIPEDRHEDFKRWSDALVSTGPATDIKDRMPDIKQMGAYFRTIITKRRENPSDDLVSQIVHGSEGAAQMSDDEIAAFCMLLLIAGNETTSNLLSNLLDYVAKNPKVWERLRDNPDKVDSAVEEALRYDAPVQWTNRKAIADTVLHGQKIKAGDVVYVVMGSANHDPDHYDRPEIFSLDRKRGDHLSLGHGIHFCIGAPLARMEARYALLGLMKRYKSIRHSSSGENERTYSNMLRGYHHLWLDMA